MYTLHIHVRALSGPIERERDGQRREEGKDASEVTNGYSESTFRALVEYTRAPATWTKEIGG